MTPQQKLTPATPPLVEEKLTGLSHSRPMTGAKCQQCGHTIRHMPVFLKNVTCRDCYGAERYKRGETSMIGTGRKIPEPAEPTKPSP